MISDKNAPANFWLRYSEAAACNMVMNVTPRGSTYINAI